MRRSPSAEGFSLLELLIVITMIILLAVFTMPAIGSTLRAARLTQGTQQVIDQIHLARQQSITRNRAIETRFYRFTGEDDWRRMQSYELLEDGSSQPVGRIIQLPEGIRLLPDAALSTMLGSDRTRTWTARDPQPALPGAGTSYATRSVLFYPDGSTDLPAGSKHWFVSLAADKVTGGTLPDNFSVIQVNPWTGNTQLYRP